ncbi:2-hydroxychromene-2-carboxylate isomerase [Pelomonas sp. P7]|uniref:2-hydroxychromene-2-carboxylate isomerase n=1 Tax=Pelomonas caseinilytica TaxID=2906763 RepID=A0ABS8XG58_9BURK|nr:2-hydroxychromene-2-carboxylate isomerase [Pelomonas sp. P7]MCE4536235.1 2-hydroxychromene-2-carboxylate isomerase [Pelomonas sp. P7]
MTRRIEFWFDMSSNYSYVSSMRIEAAAARAGVGVAWLPFLLGPIFAELGWSTSPFVLQKAKGAYVWRDMQRQCAKHGIAFRRPSDFPRKATLPMRIAAAHADEAWMPAFCQAVMAENFAHDRAMDDEALCTGLLGGLGADAATVLAQSASPEGRAALRRNTEQAQGRGIFGAPTFFVGAEMFWGDDRLDDALAWAARREFGEGES